MPPRVKWGLSIWLLLVSVASLYLVRYQITPGEAGNPPEKWPEESHLQLHQNKLSLLMFIHPRCPCTESSLRELNRLLTVIDEKVSATIVVSLPGNVSPEWTNNQALKALETKKDLLVYYDRTQRETDRFQIKTSGDVALYSPSGTLLFSGGITVSRGHDGDAAGQQLIRLAKSEQREVGHTEVFGCTLQTPEEFCSAED